MPVQLTHRENAPRPEPGPSSRPAPTGSDTDPDVEHSPPSSAVEADSITDERAAPHVQADLAPAGGGELQVPEHVVHRAASLLSKIAYDHRQKTLDRFFASSPEELAEYRKLPKDQRRSTDPRSFGPYPWQVEFFNAGNHYARRCIMAANRVGKSECCSAETAIHLTGRYPNWWVGKRFKKPPLVWVGSETNEASRDIVQGKLLGPPGEYGTGWIPGRLLDPNGPDMRQCGIKNVVDTIRVKHVSGGWSVLQFKTYEQGRERWQGTMVDLLWFDEEPPDDIFSEGMTRTLDSGGSTILSFTPLKGAGPVVDTFVEKAGTDGIWMKNVTWDDAPHLDENARAQLLAAYNEWEIDTRTKGIPMMGEGAVYPIREERIICDPFEIPEHFFRICGIDFGYDHPTAGCFLAIDRDADVVYVYDEHRLEREIPAVHAASMIAKGAKVIPVAWPHDGVNAEKGSGLSMAEQYESLGLNMMPVSARYYDEKGGGQPTEPVVMEILQRMRSNRFKVFSTCRHWLEERRRYHRKDGKIARVHDDVLSACHYAVMMMRYAEQPAMSSRRGFVDSVQSDFDPLSEYR